MTLQRTGNRLFAIRRHELTNKIRNTAVKAMLCGGMLALALSVTGSAASAQTIDPPLRFDFGFRIGSYIPTESEIRQAGGTHNLTFDIDWVPEKFFDRRGFSVVSVGYYERDGFKMIPVTVGYMVRESSDFLGRTYYYGVGGGLYQTRVNLPDTSARNKWIPGGYAAVGVDLTRRIYLDLRYHYVARYDRKFVGGTQLSAGIRF
jgi:hypothetical protein